MYNQASTPLDTMDLIKTLPSEVVYELMHALIDSDEDVDCKRVAKVKLLHRRGVQLDLDDAASDDDSADDSFV